MKNVVKISILMAMITVATMSCSKDNDNDEPLVSGAFNGTVTAAVDGGAALTVNAVLALNDPGFDYSGDFDGNLIGDGGSFKNGSFTITLPTSGLSSYLVDVAGFFDDFMAAGDKGKLKVSNPSTRVLDVDFVGFYYDDDEDEVYVSGLFFYATADKSIKSLFVYADSDVDVTGGKNVSVRLKQGWNRVYVSDKLTTKAPESMKWYFEKF